MAHLAERLPQQRDVLACAARQALAAVQPPRRAAVRLAQVLYGYTVCSNPGAQHWDDLNLFVRRTYLGMVRELLRHPADLRKCLDGS